MSNTDGTNFSNVSQNKSEASEEALRKEIKNELDKHLNNDVTSTFQLLNDAQNTENRVEHQSYQNLPEFLKQDVDRLIKYDRLLGRLLSSTGEKISNASLKKASKAETKATVTGEVSTGINPAAQNLTTKDLEKLCEFIRMDKGLPLAYTHRRKKIDTSKPVTYPKLNRATILRDEQTKKNIMVWNEATNQQDIVTRSPVDPLTVYKKAARRAREEAKKRRMLRQPLIRGNKQYELRYQHNKGEPVMPSVFKKFYENYRKPPFRLVKRLQLPKNYLLPLIPKNAVSVLGLISDPSDFGGLSSVYRKGSVKADTRTPREKARPKLRKGKHVLRRTKPSMRTGKRPWNYGTYRRDNRWRL